MREEVGEPHGLPRTARQVGHKAKLGGREPNRTRAIDERVVGAEYDAPQANEFVARRSGPSHRQPPRVSPPAIGRRFEPMSAGKAGAFTNAGHAAGAMASDVFPSSRPVQEAKTLAGLDAQPPP